MEPKYTFDDAIIKTIECILKIEIGAKVSQNSNYGGEK